MKSKVVLAATLVLAVLAGPLLYGCTESAEETTVVVIRERYPLPEEGIRALARFDQAYSEHGSGAAASRELKHFRDAFRRIRSSYVIPVTDDQLIDAAIDGMRTADEGDEPVTPALLVDNALDAMTASLDPHSVYLDPQELREAELATAGEFGGLGIQVSRDENAIRIISPIEDTPAERAGLKPGDLITHVDGRPVGDMKLIQAVRAMRGKPGTTIRLGIERDSRRFDVAIVRAIIAIQPIRWKVEDDVIYIRVANFNEKTGQALAEAFNDIGAQQGTNVRGVVLDLRNNPGGLFDQSLHVADAFLDEGVIVSMRGRDTRRIRQFHAREGDVARGVPMVVMINGGSASASEIVASALQENGRAIVMGTPSFGKGSVQTVMRLPVEGALKLTTALYYSPRGQAIQARGVEPDIELESEEEAAAPSRETDLPKALPAAPTVQPHTVTHIDVEACPPLAGGNDDRELACAIAYLRASNLDTFVRGLVNRPTG